MPKANSFAEGIKRSSVYMFTSRHDFCVTAVQLKWSANLSVQGTEGDIVMGQTTLLLRLLTILAVVRD